MSYVIPGELPSLAHPIITIPRRGVKNDKNSLRCPPFPDINRNADGFTFSHLPWLGIKMANGAQMTAREHRRSQVVTLHEVAHYHLAKTPFSVFINIELFKLHSLIFRTFYPTLREEQQQIPVPLLADLLRNEMEKQWSDVVLLHRASSLVEEVFAVRSSLRKAREQGIIKSDKQLEALVDAYKKQYEEDENIDGFRQAYETFDVIACKIGEDAATAMILSVLETLSPATAFSNILFFISDCLCNIDTFKNFVSRLPFKDALVFFYKILGDLDEDDSHYGRRSLLQAQATIEQFLNTTVKAGSKFSELLSIRDTTAFVFSVYNHNLLRFSKIEGSAEVRYGDLAIFLESIRQQLTQGRGLQCPWWNGSPGTCCSSCSSFHRAFLEKVWSCTSESACENWGRLGCLAC
jgi:hypothetical protein